MAINQIQLEQIETFVKSKYVEYYDIQVELVDHLASNIEQEMDSNPNLDFDKALTNGYKKFGIFGFSDFVEERQKAVYSQSIKKYWKTFFEFFKIPNFVYSLLIFTLFYLVAKNANGAILVVVFIMVFILVAAFSIYFSFIQKRKQKLKLVQREYQPFWISLSGFILNLSSFFLNKNEKEFIFFNPLIIASFLTILIIGTWAEIIARQRIFEKLQLDYPSAFKLD